jgi:cell wall-associated NlpC family hydrolase
MGLKFLGAPYLWGGRSPFGVDCSGLVQVLYKVDAKDQIAFGETVDFAHSAKAGDLAFFDNEEGRVTHVGMVLEPGKILHASGQVRIDALDQQGIYNSDEKSYTHRLRLIKRLL